MSLPTKQRELDAFEEEHFLQWAARHDSPAEVRSDPKAALARLRGFLASRSTLESAERWINEGWTAVWTEVARIKAVSDEQEAALDKRVRAFLGMLGERAGDDSHGSFRQ